MLQRRIDRYPVAEIRFNLMAMVRDLRLRSRDMGDVEGVEREEAKRKAWLWENALRRHNFVGFIGEVLKGVVREMIRRGDGSFDEWVEEGMQNTKERVGKTQKGEMKKNEA